MQVNDRVTVKTDGGPRRSGVVLAIESFSEGTMYLVSAGRLSFRDLVFQRNRASGWDLRRKRSLIKRDWRYHRQSVSTQIHLNT